MPSLTTLVDGTVPVAADFNNNYAALNVAIGSSTSISAWATGELPYASAANTLSRLTPGTVGQVLTMTATVPSWAAPAGITDQLSGLTLSNDVGTPNTVLDIALGLAASDDAAYANRTAISLTSAFTKNMNSAWAVGSGSGGLATGVALANNTWYHVFAILRPDTGVVDVAADTSVTGANISSLASAAYTKKRRIGSFATDGSAHILPFFQQGDEFYWTTPNANDVSATNPGTAAVLRTVAVPLGVKVQAILNVSVNNGTTSGIACYLTSPDAADVAAVNNATPLGTVITGATAATAQVGAQARVWTNTSQQVRSRLSASGASDVLYICTMGWFDRRGKG